MLVPSILSGLLSTMNTWCYDFSHIRLHLNDVYMIILMVSSMFFFSYIINEQHDNGHQNVTNLWIIIILMILSFYLIRTQTFITDEQFIKGMIPHHSMAILMSEKIKEKTYNPIIKNLANEIIKNQLLEIELMKKLEDEI